MKTQKPDIILENGDRLWCDVAQQGGKYVCILRDNKGLSVIEGYGSTAQEAKEDAAQALYRPFND